MSHFVVLCSGSNVKTLWIIVISLSRSAHRRRLVFTKTFPGKHASNYMVYEIISSCLSDSQSLNESNIPFVRFITLDEIFTK